MDWKEEEWKEIELLNEMYVNAVIQRVRKNPDLLAFVWQTSAICEAATEVDPSAIRHVKNPEEVEDEVGIGLCELVIHKDPGVIGLIKAPSKGLCICAVEIDPEVIHSIKWDHPSLWDREDRLDVYIAAARAERKNGPASEYRVFESRPEPSGIDWKLAEEAETVASHLEMIDIDPHSIAEIEHPSKRVCIYAVRSDPSVFHEIKLDHLDEKDRRVVYAEAVALYAKTVHARIIRDNGLLWEPDKGIDYDLASEICNYADRLFDQDAGRVPDTRKDARPRMRM